MTTAPPSRVFGARRAMRGVAAEELRRHNLGAILERLHLVGPASRSELTAMTGLNRSTIAALIGELAALGLVEEGPAPRTAGPGRPSPVVAVRPEGAVALAVVMEVESITVATVGLGGRVYDQVRSERSRRDVSPSDAVAEIAAQSAGLLAALPQPHRLAGASVAVAAVTRRKDGLIHLAPNLRWREVPFGAMVADALGLDLPILVANEADLGALGEYRRGRHPDVANLVYVSGEVGIGTGVIIDGKPLLGAAGYAGEAGHMLINPAGRPCQCGSVGCWETEAGEAALVRLAGVPTRPSGTGGGAAAIDAASIGDHRALDAAVQVGQWLGRGIANLVNIFNPQLVVLGGLYRRLFPYFEDVVRDSMHRGVLHAPGERVTIVQSRLGSGAPLVGAAERVMARVVADPAGFVERLPSVEQPVS